MSRGADSAPRAKGLFETWLELEYAEGKRLNTVLSEVNAACGTAYYSNWPSKMAARGYTLERIPDEVRRYMLRKVLPTLAEGAIVPDNAAELDALVRRLT